MAWAYGMAVSVLFLALWGRAVVIDTDALAESLSPLAGSSAVVDVVGDWMAEEMVDSGADPGLVQPAIDYYFQSSSVGHTLDQFAVEVVGAAASSDPDGAAIDMAGLLGPAVPDLAVGLVDLGYPVTEGEVADVVRGLDPLVIRQPGTDAIVGPNSPTAARLGTAALLALLSLLALGYGYVTLSEDRVGAVRSLLNRIAVGGLSFALFLRLGAWVLDPEGGRAPVPETLSSVAGSKWAVPLQVAVVAALIAGAIYLTRRWIRRRGGLPLPGGRSTPRRERSESISGSR
jgi:hypothetical protein